MIQPEKNKQVAQSKSMEEPLFILQSLKTVHGTWESGNLGGQVGAQWKTLVVSTGSGNQDIGYGDFYEEPSASVSFSIQWMDIAWVEVIKRRRKEQCKTCRGCFWNL